MPTTIYKNELHQLAEKPNLIDNQDITKSLQNFARVLQDIIECANTDLHGILKNIQYFVNAFEEEKENHELQGLVSALQDLQKELSASLQDQDFTWANKGKIVLTKNFFYEILNSHTSICVSSDYTSKDCLELLELMKKFKDEFIANASFLEPKVDALFVQLAENFKKFIQNNKNIYIKVDTLMQSHIIMKNVSEIIIPYIFQKIEYALFSATCYCIDFEGRQQGLYFKTCPTNDENVAALYKTHNGLLNAIQQLKNYSQHCLLKQFKGGDPYYYSLHELFNFLYLKFQHMVNIFNKIDEEGNGLVKRLKYFSQNFDKANFFNEGHCLGSIRDWTNEVYNFNLNNNEAYKPGKSVVKKIFARYEELHDYNISPEMHNLQKNQSTFQQLNHTGNHYAFKCIERDFSDSIGDHSIMPAVIDKMLYKLIKIDLLNLVKNYLNVNGFTPIFTIGLYGNKSGHAIGVYAFKEGNKIYFRYRDINIGVFECHHYEVFYWLVKKCFYALNYHLLYNKYAISSFPMKNVRNKEMISAFHNYISSSKHPLYAALHHEQGMNLKKNLIQNEMKQLFHKALFTSGHAGQYYLELVKVFNSIIQPSNLEYLVTIQTLSILSSICEDVDKPRALECISSAMELSKKLLYSNENIHLIYQKFTLNIQGIPLLFNINDTLDEENFHTLKNSFIDLYKLKDHPVFMSLEAAKKISNHLLIIIKYFETVDIKNISYNHFSKEWENLKLTSDVLTLMKGLMFPELREFLSDVPYAVSELK